MDLIIPHFYSFFQEKCSRNRTSFSDLHHMSNYPAGIILFHENSPRAGDRIPAQPSPAFLPFVKVCSGRQGEGIVPDGNWEENHSWGSSSSALEAKKWDVHRNPFSSWKSGWVYSKQEIGRVCSCSSPLPGFELWLLVPHWGHCPSGGIPVVPGAPSYLDSGHPVPGLFALWDFRVCSKSRIFWVPRKPEGPLGRVCGAEQSRLCHPSSGNGSGSLGALTGLQ